ncbi:MAG: prephenate dehydrogenase/arogenate dehydrogenase family protein [Chloroflexi bacterium]|nr:prephenate dehydrogenase/arogenate dehydrogenase family protein [Chloroflexota bacterium]
MAANERIAIVGLGLVGTSIGLALKRANLPSVEVVGHDRDSGVAARAKKRGAVDRTDWNLISTVEKATLVVIATPALAVKEVLTAIALELPAGCVVTDTSSTKAQILTWAQEILPPTVNFVGGHPIGGKNESGPEAADPDLFKGALYCLVPLSTARKEAVETVVGLANILGARPYFADAHEHDGFVAGTTHLPTLLASALVSATTGSTSWREMSRLTASGYVEVSRLVGSDPAAVLDGCLMNRESILRWIDAYVEELQRYRALIAEGGEALQKHVEAAQVAHQRWLFRKERGEEDEGSAAMREIPRASDGLAQMFVGRRLLDATRKLDDKERGKRK